MTTSATGIFVTVPNPARFLPWKIGRGLMIMMHLNLFLFLEEVFLIKKTSVFVQRFP